MHPNFHQFLYDFFIKNHDLNYIAATYESSWYEVAEVVDSEPARKYMHAAIRAERLRDIARNLATRRFALRTLEGVIENRSLASTGEDGRRRAATAILNGTKPGRASGSARAPRPTATRAPNAQSIPPSPAISSTPVPLSPPPISQEPATVSNPKPASSTSYSQAPDPSRPTKATSNAQPPRVTIRAEKPRSNFKTRRARPQSNTRANPHRENSS